MHTSGVWTEVNCVAYGRVYAALSWGTVCSAPVNPLHSLVWKI